MSAPLKPLHPHEVAKRMNAGRAVLVDIREPDEFARAHVQGALSHPLSKIDTLGVAADQAVVFACKAGLRTAGNAPRLALCAGREAYVMEGGLDAWIEAGLPVEVDRKAPLEIMRQVQIAAGLLILAGVALGFLVHPAFFGLSAFVGAGLTLAGATGFCGMARMLGLAPWNRRAAA
jgi:rhodanese-related sulfurtransferase